MSKKTNIASSGFTAVQAGRIVPQGDDDTPADASEAPKPPRKPGKGRTINIQSGKGQVGVQADTIIGDLNIQM